MGHDRAVRYPRVLPVGDAAATIELDSAVSPAAAALADALQADPPVWLLDAVPTLAAVLVRYEPATTRWAEVHDVLHTWAQRPAGAPPEDGRTVVLPARYDGPDLADVARATGLTADEVVTLHASTTYRVQMVGFLPGFAYLGPLPEQLRLPRRSTPRVRIPARSIAVADAFTAVYPSSSPGGWHLIGSVPASIELLQHDDDPPCLLAPGDLVRFEP